MMRKKPEKTLLSFLVLVISCWVLSNHCYSKARFGEEAEEDTVDFKRNGVIFLPVLFYQPETKLAGGILVTYYFREPGSVETSRPSTLTPVFVYTQKKQIISDLSADIYWENEAYHLVGYVGYTKFPDKFYGIGNNTSSDDEEDYTPRNALLALSFQKRMGAALYVGSQYEFAYVQITEVEDTGVLAQKTVTGSDGGTTSGAGFVVNFDTRNNIFYPSSGRFYQASASVFDNVLGSDFAFSRINFDLRQYFSFYSAHVMAVQGYVNIMTGDPPFQMLSMLGGPNLMRGYYEGRYRDRSMIAVQMEHRFAIWWRIGLAGFVGFGDVARSVSEFQFSEFKHSVGLGIRYLFGRDEKINVRFDFAFGRDSAGFYVDFLEAF